MKCRICGNDEETPTFEVKEIMFGTVGEFKYFECPRCGCLQILEVPKDMSNYYPESYYRSDQTGSKRDSLVELLRKATLRARISLKGDFVFKRVKFGFPMSIFFSFPKCTRIDFSSKILDVGCGKGSLMVALHNLGFKYVSGIDPYSTEKAVDGLKILKTTIHAMPNSQVFDLVIFNHSFEHIQDQLETLIKISKILSKTGICLIRMPVKTEYIWNRYGVNWVQIDAPRHFYIHTLESFSILAKEAGFTLKNVVFDSTDFQFWGSEQCVKGIPLRSEKSYWVDPGKSEFTLGQIEEFRMKTRELNRNNQGDQAQFYLVKTETGICARACIKSEDQKNARY